MGGEGGAVKNMFLCCIPEEYVEKIKESISEFKQTMGNFFGDFKNMFKPHISADSMTRITGNVFDSLTEGERVKNKTINCEQLHEGITAVFKKINETIPGANCDLPSKDAVDKMLKDSNVESDKLFDRQEFGEFVRKFSDHIVIQNCFAWCGLHKKAQAQAQAQAQET